MKAIILATTAMGTEHKCQYQDSLAQGIVVADVLVMMCGDSEPRSYYFCAYHYGEFAAETLDWLSSHGAAMTDWYPR